MEEMGLNAAKIIKTIVHEMDTADSARDRLHAAKLGTDILGLNAPKERKIEHSGQPTVLVDYIKPDDDE